ncbi:hypothetical protein BKA64DRAFT_679640 [Cadophora sp. MPI-SDFR-AT-0126]|nr:hypothetical protein BKA64DRAFT_679640 [Leotiomycetes sp. MPI-SDFR-AT-0126]
MEFQLFKHGLVIALTTIGLLMLIFLTTHEDLVVKTKNLFDTAQNSFAHGKVGSNVALIIDTKYTKKLVPLILHYHSVLGPDWPIVFYTSQETSDLHFSPETAVNQSAIWQRAVGNRAIDVRILPADVDLTQRDAVNLFLSRRWLWEQMAPAQHVLLFQADSMICGNSYRRIEDWLKYDYVGAPVSPFNQPAPILFNGGLSLRNRTMILDILNEGNSLEEDSKKKGRIGGEDMWFSRKMAARGAKLPDYQEALGFACQKDWHISMVPEPLGYHKVHLNAPLRLKQIAQWCPEIALAAPGHLDPAP